MAWFAIIETGTNRLHTLAEDHELADIPKEFRTVALVGQPTVDEQWDADTETFVPRPAPVFGNLIDDIINDPSLLPILQKAELRAVLEAKLSPDSKVYTK